MISLPNSLYSLQSIRFRAPTFSSCVHFSLIQCIFHVRFGFVKFLIRLLIKLMISIGNVHYDVRIFSLNALITSIKADFPVQTSSSYVHSAFSVFHLPNCQFISNYLFLIQQSASNANFIIKTHSSYFRF